MLDSKEFSMSLNIGTDYFKCSGYNRCKVTIPSVNSTISGEEVVHSYEFIGHIDKILSDKLIGKIHLGSNESITFELDVIPFSQVNIYSSTRQPLQLMILLTDLQKDNIKMKDEIQDPLDKFFDEKQEIAIPDEVVNDRVDLTLPIFTKEMDQSFNKIGNLDYSIDCKDYDVCSIYVPEIHGPDLGKQVKVIGCRDRELKTPIANVTLRKGHLNCFDVKYYDRIAVLLIDYLTEHHTITFNLSKCDDKEEIIDSTIR